MHGSICIKYPEQAIHRVGKQISGCEGLGKGYVLSFRDDENILDLDSADDTIHYLVHFKWVNWIVCVLYVNNVIIFFKSLQRHENQKKKKKPHE